MLGILGTIELTSWRLAPSTAALSAPKLARSSDAVESDTPNLRSSSLSIRDIIFFELSILSRANVSARVLSSRSFAACAMSSLKPLDTPSKEYSISGVSTCCFTVGLRKAPTGVNTSLVVLLPYISALACIRCITSYFLIISLISSRLPST